MNRSSWLFFLILAGLLLLSAARWLGPASRSHASTLPSQDSFQGESAAPLLVAKVGSPSPGKATNLPEPREILVKFKASIGPQAIDALNQARGVIPLSVIPLIEVHSLRVPPGVTAVELALKYAADSAVAWAEPNYPRRITLAPTDPFYSANQKWYYDLMRAEQGWGLETGRSSVVVAVVDSGVMCTHPDLAANMWKNPGEVPGNDIDDDNNGKVDDVFGWDFVGSDDGGLGGDRPGDKDPCVAKGDPSVGDGLDNDGDGVRDGGVSHGTEVAGIVGAVANNGQGVAGMAWGVRLMAVRVMNPEGLGYCGDVADGIVYAAQNGAKIINLSLGSASLCQTESLAIDVAHDTFGATVIAASGNENQTPISYPARLPKAIAVGASDHADLDGRAPFSNWGPELAVVAPGVDIASTHIVSVAEAATTAFQVGEALYILVAGTSESTPLVSGLAALLLSRNPGLTNEQVRTTLKSTARDLPDDLEDSPNAGPTWDGAGMVDVFAALSAVAVATPTPTPVGTVTPVATATPTPAPVGTATPTATPTPVPSSLFFGPITFGTGVVESTCELSGVGTSFPSGTLRVYASVGFIKGPGTFQYKWYRDNALWFQGDGTTTLSSGCFWFGTAAAGGVPLPNGSWRLDLLGSGQVIQSGSFTIGALAPTATATATATPTPVGTATPTRTATPTPTPCPPGTTGAASQRKQAPREPYVPGELIVKFQPSTLLPQRLEALADLGLQLKRELLLPDHVLVTLPEGQDVSVKTDEALKHQAIEYAEPNYYVYASFNPNDPIYCAQWHLNMVQMPQAWDLSAGEGVTVAVVDTGVAYETFGVFAQAPDLASTLFVSGWDFVNNDSRPNDDNGHGTHVAGTIAQSTNNALGVAGVAYRARIMPVKVLDFEGQGTYANFIDGIVWATDRGARVLNLSLGGSTASFSLELAVNYAYGKGAVLVAATGNGEPDGIGDPVVGYPAAYENAIAVGAVRYDRRRSPYSNYGSTLDLVAPGGDTTVDQNRDGYSDGVLQQTFRHTCATAPVSFTVFAYCFYQGTSMASPHVAGVAALLLSRQPGATPTQIRQALQATALDLGNPGWDPEYGYGLVQAYDALKYLDTLLTPAPIVLPPTPSLPPDGQQLSGLGTTLTWTNPAGTRQVHFQVMPLNLDGPGIDLIRSDPATLAGTFSIMPPDMSAGANYVMLCGATYTWQARASSSTQSIGVTDPSWGPWSAVRRFKTRECSSATISLLSPGAGASVTGMPTLQWSDTANDIFYYEIQLSKDPRFSEGGPADPVLHLLIHGGTTTPKNSLGPANTNFQGWWNAFGGSGTYSWRVRPRKQATPLGTAETGVSWLAARTFTVP